MILLVYKEQHMQPALDLSSTHLLLDDQLCKKDNLNKHSGSEHNVSLQLKINHPMYIEGGKNSFDYLQTVDNNSNNTNKDDYRYTHRNNKI